MKKLFLFSLLLGASLVLFSFSSANSSIGSFEDVSQYSGFSNDLQLGSFSEFETTRYTSDKTEWNKRFKTWDVLSKNEDLSKIEKIINQN